MSMSKRSAGIVFAVIVFTGASLSCIELGHAQDKPLKKIRWGVTALSASNWIP